MTFKFLVKNDQTTNDVTLVTNNSKFIFLEKKYKFIFPRKEWARNSLSSELMSINNKKSKKKIENELKFFFSFFSGKWTQNSFFSGKTTAFGDFENRLNENHL
jgi:hypothetical protein